MPRVLRRRVGPVRAWMVAAAAVTLATGALAAVGVQTSYASTAGAQGGGQGHGTRLDHVFIIMLENHAADHVIGDPAAPFITSLANTYGQATDYFGVTHTSEPNYIAATSGNNWWVNNDNGWYPTTSNNFGPNQYAHTNIVDELQAAHIPWDAYMQAMPSAGYLPDFWPSSSNALYASKHNPFILYNDVRLNPARAAHIKPYTSMAADLNGPNPPRYVWISPDECSNMHGGIYTAVPGFPDTPCPYNDVPGDANDQALKAKADAFVKGAVQTITSSRAWTGNSAIFIVTERDRLRRHQPHRQRLRICGGLLRLAGPTRPETRRSAPAGLAAYRRRLGADDGDPPGWDRGTPLTPRRPTTTRCCSPSRKDSDWASSATPPIPRRSNLSGRSSPDTEHRALSTGHGPWPAAIAPAGAVPSQARYQLSGLRTEAIWPC